MAAGGSSVNIRTCTPSISQTSGCGPDSFFTHFFRHEMSASPFSSSRSMSTAPMPGDHRIEAFLDSLNNAGQGKPRGPFPVQNRSNGTLRTKKVYFPPMTDHAHALSAAFRACGVETEVLPESDDETVRIGRKHSSGRECYPLALTTGDMIKATRRPGSIRRGAPSSCLREKGLAASDNITATTGRCWTNWGLTVLRSSLPCRTNRCIMTFVFSIRILCLCAGAAYSPWT